MTKKQKTYLLLTLVIIIWGFIGIYIYKYLNPDIPLVNATSKVKFTPKKVISKQTTFTISKYRDPFLGKIVATTQKTGISKDQKVDFPQVIYHGSIKGNRKNAYIISINNQQEILKVGQSFQQVKLLQANSKRIIVRCKSITKSISLQQ